MKIQLISDMHSEHWKTADFALVDKIIPSNSKEVVLVVAGDLDNDLARIDQWMSDVFSHYKHVFYVCGNHEFYSARFPKMCYDIKEISNKYQNVTVLENDSFELDGVVFMGATLWTNCIDGIQFAHTFTDYCHIRMFDYSLLRWKHTLEAHEQSKKFIKKQIGKSKGKKVVVISHHMPKNALIHKWFLDSPINPFFASDVDIKGADLWLFGHSHISNDMTINGTRYVSNPYGYIMSNEPLGFKPQFIIEI